MIVEYKHKISWRNFKLQQDGKHLCGEIQRVEVHQALKECQELNLIRQIREIYCPDGCSIWSFYQEREQEIRAIPIIVKTDSST